MTLSPSSHKTLTVNGKDYHYISLKDVMCEDTLKTLPLALKILLENTARAVYLKKQPASVLDSFSKREEIFFYPARVLMQDFTGVPAIVDLAAMRDAAGDKASSINPLIPVDLVIDHSVMVDTYASADAFRKNVNLEFERNHERYTFLRWGQKSFKNFKVVPPGTGICHQVNLEHLAQVVWIDSTTNLLYPDTLVGTDSHTTMVNGLSVLGWGVGGIEAEAAMLGQGLSMNVPDVVGMKLTGSLKEGVTATDLVLTITQMLRAKGVVGKFVEFYGPGLKDLPLTDRATIANMAPEYGATCGLFPIDDQTLNYLKLSGRSQEHIDIVEAYAKAQGFWRDDSINFQYNDTLALDLSDVKPSLAGPKRPQDKVVLEDVPLNMGQNFEETKSDAEFAVKDKNFKLHHGDLVIAAITSCTNTSNPSVMIAAGLLAKKARDKGLKVKPWVKTSLAPGSQVVTDYLDKANLTEPLNDLGFNLVGYGCTTCIGNSGPLESSIAEAVDEHKLTVGAVLSGNRNFEGRVHPQVKVNYLASPPLVVAYALAGTLKINIEKDPLGKDLSGNPVYLKDIWPSSAEINQAIESCITPDLFKSRYSNVFEGSDEWKSIDCDSSETYEWDEDSTYIRKPPYFEATMRGETLGDIQGARVLALLGDSITTDHISPAGNIKVDSPAGTYLKKHNIDATEFNSYGSRRGNHEVMVRGTFANIRLQNEMVPGIKGGFTRYLNNNEIMPIYDAAMKYQSEKTPLIIIAGKEYGTGSSRDWAAKGTRLLGIKAVIAESFERIHRSNLVGMGVLPLVFEEGTTRHSLNLNGHEIVNIKGLSNGLKPKMIVEATFTRINGEVVRVPLTVRLDTQEEIHAFLKTGLLPYVLDILTNTK